MNAARTSGQAGQPCRATDADGSRRPCVPISHGDQPLRWHCPRRNSPVPSTVTGFSTPRNKQVGQFPPPGRVFLPPPRGRWRSGGAGGCLQSTAVFSSPQPPVEGSCMARSAQFLREMAQAQAQRLVERSIGGNRWVWDAAARIE